MKNVSGYVVALGLCFIIGMLMFSFTSDTEAVLSDFDLRLRSNAPVALEDLIISLDASASGDLTNNQGSTTTVINGEVGQIIVIAPNLSNSTLMTVTGYNASDVILIQQAGFSASTSTVKFPSSNPLCQGTTTWQINTDVEESLAVDKDIELQLYYK